MKKKEVQQDYEFLYIDEDLFEHGPWCPLFGEVPHIFDNRKKHQVADRCIDIINAARDLWDLPYPYLSNGTFRTHEHLSLSNPNWPDPDEIPGYQPAIIAARSIACWNHFHIVTNACDYRRSTQFPYPYHWHENDAGILHYARTSMNHFAQPGGVGKETCPLLAYPPGSSEEAELIKYERNMEIQDEARNVPDYLVFAALAIAEAWDVLTEVLYYGQREKSKEVLQDITVVEKFLEKAYKVRIKADKKDIDKLAKDADVIAADAVERHKKERLQKAQQKIAESKQEIRDAAVSEAQDILSKSEKPLRKWTVVKEIARRIDDRNAINVLLLLEEPGAGAIERYIKHLFSPTK